ncbi:tubulin polyglutamylase complex subunit 2-like, partial [Anopheles maculipalpis]|uniref:tubulin polyglutamylase complex subunit 2-like n=1 Tax=Anopheles maculipalpis TaxID=1496333 RepID=UPI0021592033
MASLKLRKRFRYTSLEHLTLGLMNKLKKLPRVTDVKLDAELPCKTAEITAWETKNSVRLPDDMKQFYLSTDGFSVKWTYCYSKRKQISVGHLNIPKLRQIRNLDLDAPGRMFELDRIGDLGVVYLVYRTRETTRPEIYIMETDTLKFTFLAHSFTNYLRMSIVHLGLPYWQLAFASCGLPGWAEQLFLLLAPHLLNE